jgi:hypothetical protein
MAKVVARLLATAAFWVRIQTFLKIQNKYLHEQRRSAAPLEDLQISCTIDTDCAYINTFYLEFNLLS